MKKVISESKGFIQDFEVVNGTLNLQILTSAKSSVNGELCDEVFRIPYTGDMATANKLINDHGPRRVMIIIEMEFEEEKT